MSPTNFFYMLMVLFYCFFILFICLSYGVYEPIWLYIEIMFTVIYDVTS